MTALLIASLLLRCKHRRVSGSPDLLGGCPVHFEGIISSMPPSSEARVAFSGKQPRLVARDRLIAVVALGKGADAAI